ncbi:MAG TPA: 1-acyl-sn-glycerol-3-phosphate acyltransferase [Pseudogracilibacillus sp.]|nr:1-acyl-sn-glycerol-3-phosphate acyltransferase [Pseudogracilibacillus sp.]
MLYNIAWFLVKVFLSLFGPVKVHQRDKLPDDEGVLIACTHTGWVDILWLGVAIYPIRIHYMAKKELFDSAFLKWLMNGLNAFPVDRENPGPSSIKQPVRLIKDGKVVGIFPSGTRTSEDVPLKRGAVTIAAHAKTKIIPAAYVGPNNFKELFRFKRPHLIFGDAIEMRTDVSRKEGMEIMADELNERLKQLQDQVS